MKNQYKSNYKLLNIKSNANWKDLKTSYRRLAQMWHPDRHPDGSKDYAYAHDKFLQITKAFDELQAFYKLSGHLPFETIEKKDASLLSVKNNNRYLARSKKSQGKLRRPKSNGAGRKLTFIFGFCLIIFLLLIGMEDKKTNNNQSHSYQNNQRNNQLGRDFSRGKLLGAPKPKSD